MIPLETVLSRMGERIEDLIGKDHYRLLKTIDGNQLSNQKELIKITFNLHTKWDLLRRKETREIIIKSFCLLYTPPSLRDSQKSRMPTSA